VTLRARWVALRARWVTLRARWVTLRARWVTLRARWVTPQQPAATEALQPRAELESPQQEAPELEFSWKRAARAAAQPQLPLVASPSAESTPASAPWAWSWTTAGEMHSLPLRNKWNDKLGVFQPAGRREGRRGRRPEYRRWWRVSPPHRPRDDELTHDRDTSVTNLATALGELLESQAESGAGAATRRAAIQHVQPSGKRSGATFEPLLHATTAGVLDSQPLHATEVAVQHPATTAVCSEVSPSALCRPQPADARHRALGGA
jgi:hypothetical protein